MQEHSIHSSKASILVVDDTPDNLRLLSAILTGAGYHVRKALNGQMALTACQTILPDLILLDINMPVMNGYEVCRQLKEMDKTQKVPVIFISALDDVLDKVKAFEVGGIDYITKPFQSTEVLLRVENQLKIGLLQSRLQEQNFTLKQALDELKQAQSQLVQNEKMVALGQLAAGMAHEINNPISFIYSNLKPASQYFQDLLKIIEAYQHAYPHPTSPVQETLQNIDLEFTVQDFYKIVEAMNRGTERIHQLVLSLKNFTRLNEAQMKSVDIHEGLDSTLVMLQSRFHATEKRPEIQVIKDYGDLPKITCYASQINQVFIHLLSNAIDAIEEAMKGKIESENHEPGFIKIRTQYLNPDKITIHITDSGLGIPETILPRLFDPFFTTKPVGSGTGLGLSISYQIIVKQHQGQLTCCSTPGQGAEFLIVLPVSPASAC
jgi:signal transduction histidine kinase